MAKKRLEDKFEEEYHISAYIIVYKFLLGLVELLLGFGIVFGGRQIFDIYLAFRNQELLEDPHDLLARLLGGAIPYVFEHQVYVVLVLIAIGLTKIIGSVALYQRKHWGLDILVGLTIFLLPVDGYNLLRHPSLSELAFFSINIFISLYLVNFKPKHYFTGFKKRTKFRR